MGFYGHADQAIEKAMEAYRRMVAKHASVDDKEVHTDVKETVRFVLNARDELKRRRGQDEEGARV